MKSKIQKAAAGSSGEAVVVDTSAVAVGNVSVKELAALFKLFADESRLQILTLLMQHDELNVRTLCDKLQQNQPAVSHHLSLLRTAGVVDRRREGKHNYYHMLPQRICELLQTVFDSAGQNPGGIRLGGYVLSLTPHE